MKRTAKNVVADLTNILKEAIEKHSPIEAGDFVHFQSPDNGEWYIESINKVQATISNSSGEKKVVPVSSLEVIQKKLTDADFHDMPMKNSLQVNHRKF